ncbi:sugar transporter [Cohnella sp. CIP 111063]|jgi:multiple sugar transport system permease protein|uniref:carbohydrate ABC transporter permease n=1 Tax=unclassified Cohnella TaxID=2636738 RepID=UPI000B8BF2F2|nr:MULTISPECIES: sugar ABC transporter permease [unclassified Cohnella]OXS56908.1 sugar transporter [Cohnella sp. CIP 111063]PRX69749.1 carbohydrate ABC transporter membrane protein 1 (CUT1 family) [Cohnella sp. SGD-V74]
MKRKEYAWAYLFISAPILGFLLFAFIPLSYSVYVSFTEYSGYQAPVFTGTANYVKLAMDDELFWKTLFNTFYSALSIPIGMAVALGIAMALNQKVRGIRFFRTMFFLPTISSVIALTLLWKWIFNDSYGLLNYLLELVGVQGPAWLSSETWAMPAMIIQGVWAGLGINMVLYLAALQGVPKSFHEAAEIDGASRWQRFVRITIPCISPTTLYILITSTITALQDFPRFQIMTEGGPNYSTTTIVYYLFQNAFRYMSMGYASAMAWALGLLILAITLLNFWLSRRWVHYD